MTTGTADSDQNPPEKKDHPVRDVLRSLPRLHARDGFELRLQKRIAAGTADSAPDRMEEAPFPTGLPRFVYSAAAVAASVVLISSFLLVQLFSPISRTPGVTGTSTRVSPDGSAGKQNPVIPAVTGTEPPAAAGRDNLHLPGRSQAGLRPSTRSTGDKKLTPVAESAVGITATRESNPQPAETSRQILLMNKQQSVTGTLELQRSDSAGRPNDRSRKIVPRVRDEFGVGVAGTAISSPLLDSSKSDSLRRLKKQMLQPSITPPKPHN